jgi:hypothetical protein
MKKLFSALLCTFLISAVAPGQSALIDKKKFFTDQTILPVTLVTSMNKIRGYSNPKKVNIYPARLTCQLPDSITITGQVEVEIRGHYRRENCQLPPLRIIFTKKDAAPSPLASLKKLKLVNTCVQNSVYNQYVLMEFLTYKIYNLLTEKSFRVRLAEVTYIDSSAKKKPAKNYAFFIEDVKEMAKRNKCREHTAGKPKGEMTDRKQMTLVALFQYMIGNTDWSVTGKHNIKNIISRKDSTGKPFAVPYDFDYAGLVNTSYAIPDPNLEIKSVTERVYRGYARTMEELNESLTVFRNQKDNIFSVINNFELLSKKNKKYMIDYLDEFYSLIKDPGKVEYTFINGARTQ